MPDLAQSVDVVIAYAVEGDDRYERAASRLLAEIALAGDLTMREMRTAARSFEHLPADPNLARTALMRWCRTARQ